MKNAITALGKLSGKDPLKLLEELRKQNKAKVWSISPIQISVQGSNIIENSEQVKTIVEMMKTHKEDVCKNALDLVEVENTKENISVVLTWFKGTRIQLTKPLDDIKSNFTALENEMDELIKGLKKKEDEIKEKDYKIAEKAICDELGKLLDNSLAKPDQNIFNDFIENKRKNKGMIPNDKGKLPAASLKTIKEQFDLVAEPMLKQIELDVKKKQQSQAFDLYLDGITVTGSVDHLEANIVSLGQLKMRIDELYPDIKDECHRRIENTTSTKIKKILT